MIHDKDDLIIGPSKFTEETSPARQVVLRASLGINYDNTVKRSNSYWRFNVEDSLFYHKGKQMHKDKNDSMLSSLDLNSKETERS